MSRIKSMAALLIKKARAANRKAARAEVSAEFQAKATLGRREVAAGKRPPIKTAILIVLDKDSLTTVEVVRRLRRRKWVPRAKDTKQYVGWLLSKHPELYEPVRRGCYRARQVS